MHDEHPHPLLAQVPLTLSPFLSLPTSVPLPYSYKSLPSTLPPSILSAQHPAYVVSSTGTSATPDQILSSCVALQQHLQKLENDARKELKDWQDRRRAEDLAEKRRLAPGWLDNDVHIIRPDNTEEAGAAAQSQPDLMDTRPPVERKEDQQGEELDRVFGGLKV
ncbi:uncharacterized protein K460DRAFT_333055 [Cucurbitaria berberidis CBS 394.84]|uniref:Uncharacterized protein n=1 Tax=Cucurbitaria berberidis CBS 394.84 TaxID=1168544 RepID=A0A9P4GLE2_9PLEO|nr:uncharacterized protein K460DRAFT_333055 [Cucurbitaria berberidis CBS 394.84]KAF1847740.1 hypothetical protein K460DRAFT_333055 [Cucurbitaria berberidis CBS 394.84]